MTDFVGPELVTDFCWAKVSDGFFGGPELVTDFVGPELVTDFCWAKVSDGFFGGQS